MPEPKLSICIPTYFLPQHLLSRHISKHKFASFEKEDNVPNMLFETLKAFPYFWIFMYPLLRVKNRLFLKSYFFLIRLFTFLNRNMGEYFSIGPYELAEGLAELKKIFDFEMQNRKL